jgi:hypothetical protein
VSEELFSPEAAMATPGIDVYQAPPASGLSSPPFSLMSYFSYLPVKAALISRRLRPAFSPGFLIGLHNNTQIVYNPTRIKPQPSQTKKVLLGFNADLNPKRVSLVQW